MNTKRPRVSIVIPVYNEEDQLAACLDTIAIQTQKPFEVIVVDNNSTDRSAAIARTYSFVRVVTERRRGLVYARDRGFNAARGDVIGRIDTDSRLSKDWVATLEKLFMDPDVDAASGSIGFHDVPFKAFFGRVDNLFRRYLARSLASQGELFLYGSNMAIRRNVWMNIQAGLCRNGAFHEDIDLAAHLAHSSFTVAFENSLYAEVSARRVDSRFRSYYPYVMANSRTYAAHRLKGRFYMYPIEWLTVIAYIPLRLLYRSYDSRHNRLSWKRIFLSVHEERISPITDA